MSSIRCWPLFGLFLLLSGCYENDTLEGTLEELEGARLRVGLTSTTGWLQLGASTIKDPGKCLRFTGRASLDGKALEQVEAGGGGRFFIPGFGSSVECTEPAWRFDLSAIPEGVSEFEVADGTGRLLFGVSALAAQRSVSFHGPVPGPVPGGPVTLDWSPATDQLIVSNVSLDGVNIPDPEILIRNGRIGFLLPSTVSPGPHTVGLEVFDVQAGVTHCEPDPERCFTRVPPELAPTRPEVTITVQ